jgi:hypothetical protein
MSDTPSERPEEESKPPFSFFDFMQAGDTGDPPVRPPSPFAMPLMGQDPMQTHHVLMKALGEVAPVCPGCGTICAHHEVLVRDCFVRRMGQLAMQLKDMAIVYFQCRKLDIEEPSDVLVKMFAAWQEVSLLYELSEPQEYYGLPEDGDPEAGESTDDDD